MDEIQSTTRREPKYTVSVDYMPDKAAVQCVTIRNKGMDSQELGDFVRDIDMNYQPMKIIVISDREEEKET